MDGHDISRTGWVIPSLVLPSWEQVAEVNLRVLAESHELPDSPKLPEGFWVIRVRQVVDETTSAKDNNDYFVEHLRKLIDTLEAAVRRIKRMQVILCDDVAVDET